MNYCYIEQGKIVRNCIKYWFMEIIFRETHIKEHSVSAKVYVASINIYGHIHVLYILYIHTYANV